MKKTIQIIALIVLALIGWFAFQNRRVAAAHNRAVQMIDAEQFDEAIALLDASAAKRPNDARVFKNLGIAYEGRGDIAQSRKNFERSLQINPDQPDIRQRLSKLGDDEALAERAAQRIERMKREGWQNEPGVTLDDILKQAEAHTQLGKPREAIILLERVLFRDPQNMELERQIEQQEALLSP